MAVSPVAIALAKKLFDIYTDDDSIVRGVGDLLLGKDDLASTITKLVDDKLFDFGGATKAADVTDALVQSLLRRIKDLQSGTGEHLKPDGVLGQRTRHWLFNRVFGHHDRPKTSLPKSNTSVNPGDGIHALRYFIEGDELPKVPGMSDLQTLILLTQAWESWAVVCRINVKQTGNRADANVIVNVRLLNDQPASVVAVADVGPPGGRQLELSFDKAETWTPHKLEATAAHEIGHLLGIHHLSAPRQLMNDTLHDDIKTPQAQDVAAAVAIWGAR